MNLIKKLVFLPIALIIASCTEAGLFIVNTQAELNAKHTLISDLAYGKDEHQKLDIYIPKAGAKNAPVIVFFYGGGWETGSKKEYEFAAEPLTSNGYIVVIPDYAKYPEFIYPTFMDDAALAAKWVVENIGKYGGDESKIFLMGHSAGGYMAAMLATNAKYLGDTRGQIKAVIGLSGPYDFIPQEQKYKDIFVAAEKSNYKSAMPASYVDGTQPPMLLIYGKKDDDVALRNLTSIQNAIGKNGGEVEVKIYDDLDHIDTVAGLSLIKRNDEMLMRILKFMGVHTK